MTQQSVKFAQERLATWNWYKNSVFFFFFKQSQSQSKPCNKSTELQVVTVLHCNILKLPRTKLLSAGQSHLRKAERSAASSELYVHTHGHRDHSSAGRRDVYSNSYTCVQAHTNIANCICWIVPAKAFLQERRGHKIVKAKKTAQHSPLGMGVWRTGSLQVRFFLGSDDFMVETGEVKADSGNFSQREIEINNIIPGKKG